MLFWIIAGAMGLIVTGFLAQALLRGGMGVQTTSAYDLQVYRDQLKEVDRDLARGAVPAEEADRLKTEIARRILAADAQDKADEARGIAAGRQSWAALLIGIVLLGGGAALYGQLGVPGASDLPLADRLAAAQERYETRPGQAEMEARLPARPEAVPSEEFATLMATLREKLAERPNDLRGHMLLARNEASLGNYRAAHAAQTRVIALKGPTVEAADYVQLADYLIAAAEGYVSPEAEAALQEGLKRDPSDGFARYYLGLMMLQNDRADAAFRLWSRLLEEGPEAAPWIAPIRARIDDVAWLAGIQYTAPAPKGPTAEEMAAAEEMSAEDRSVMIQGMVNQLAERLATDGGTPQDWARLITAYGVLGAKERAQLVWSEAQEVFAAHPDALQTLAQAAQQAGLEE